MERENYFSIFELYFLLDAFQGKLLMGLPSKEELTISSESIWTDAKEALEDKQLVDEDGRLTEAGFVVTEVLREYCMGHSLTIINNFYIMYSKETNSSVVIVDTLQGYQLLKLTPLSLLVFLQEKLPLMLGEPSDGEASFLKQELVLTEQLEGALSQEDVVVIQHYPLKSMTESKHQKELLSQLLVTDYEGRLLGYDVQKDELFQYSQYYFLERLYTWLAIPFREEDF